MLFFILSILLGMYALHAASSLLTLRNLNHGIPPEFQGLIDDQTYRRSQDYIRAKTRAGFFETTTSLLAFMVFWAADGFSWLYQWSHGWNLGPTVTGTLVLGLVFLANGIFELPFKIHHVFVVEEKFGFNRMTPRVFASDQAKTLAIAALVGTPIIAGLLELFETFPGAWLWGWLGFSAISLLLAFVAASVFLPLFNKFQPMEPGPLRSDIEALAARCGFPLSGLFVIDGSKRSTKANAYFTGFGKSRRIALFDTLIANHGRDELLAVLAHEIGHFKRHHIWQQIAFGFLGQGLLFYLLGFALRSESLHSAFGLPGTAPLPIHFGMIFFLTLCTPVTQLLAIAGNALSRRNEFQADAYAAKATGNPGALANALRKLSIDSLGNLSPHPLAVWLDHTHPPVVERIRALGTTES